MDGKQLFYERRSVGYFDKTKKIDRQTLKNIINLAVLAPSAYNLQPWRIIVVESEKNKAKLQKLSYNQTKVTEASHDLIIIGNKLGWDSSNTVWDEMLESVGGNEKIVKNSQKAAASLYGKSEKYQIKFAESNASLLAMSIMLAAKEYGVDTHPLSGIDFEGIHREFNLKKNEEVIMTICMGYFDNSKHLRPPRPRLDFDKIATII